MTSIAFINPNSTTEMTASCINAGAHCVTDGINLIGVTNVDGPPSIQGAADGEVAIPGLLSAIEANQHMDGFIIGCFDNTGLEKARKITDKPVIGIGQAAYHMAVMTNERFTVLTTLDVSVPVIKQNIKELGFSMWCDDVVASGVPVLQLEFQPEIAVPKVRQSIKEIKLQFPETAIVLGCAGMTTIKSELVEQRKSVQLIDPVTSAIRLICAAINEV